MADKIRSKKHDYSDSDFSLRVLSKPEFANEWNWMVFTKSITLRSVFDDILKSQFLSSGKSVFVLKEGVHMNAPKFFFLPNKQWLITEKTKRQLKIKNTHTGEILSIPHKFLELSLRRPEFHTKITPQLEHYLVLIPPGDNLPASIYSYIRWGEDNKLHRGRKTKWLNKYCNQEGIPWYSYMYHDAKTRTAKGNIVIMMKFRIKRRTCLVHYFDEPVRGPHMYFFGSTGNVNYDKVLVAWFNSTVSLVIPLYSRREISGDWGQVRIVDLNKYQCIDPNKLSDDKIGRICDVLDKIRYIDLPPIPEQSRNEPRKSLDLTILEALEVENPRLLLDNIYYAIESEFNL